MKTIQILAKEWFDKVNGNSYFSARIYFDNEFICALPFQYGYGNHYIDIAKRNMVKTGLISASEYEPLWRWCDENGITLLTDKESNCLKRNVKEFGIN